MNKDKLIAELTFENASLSMEILNLKSIVIEFQKQHLSEKLKELNMNVQNLKSSSEDQNYSDV